MRDETGSGLMSAERLEPFAYAGVLSAEFVLGGTR
jgi:hypothetical protein